MVMQNNAFICFYMSLLVIFCIIVYVTKNRIFVSNIINIKLAIFMLISN